MSTSLARAWKPWFVYRPGQLIRRLAPAPPATGFVPMRTAWGATLLVHPGRDIGRSLHTTGVFDLAVSEVVARLLPAGGTMVDAGANVGYVSVLAASVAGPRGRVLAFEPHPELVDVLRQNAAVADAEGHCATIDVRASALGDRAGLATLLLPDDFAANDGLARIVDEHDARIVDGHEVHAPGAPVTALATGGAVSRHIPVAQTTLDDVLGEAAVDLLKIDVEGFEAQVLAGARRALAERRIRHIVFEEHDPQSSLAITTLRAAGYQLFALGWSLRHLRLEPFTGRPASHGYEAPNYLATLDADAALTACAPAGWKVLRELAGTRHSGFLSV